MLPNRSIMGIDPRATPGVREATANPSGLTSRSSRVPNGTAGEEGDGVERAEVDFDDAGGGEGSLFASLKPLLLASLLPDATLTWLFELSWLLSRRRPSVPGVFRAFFNGVDVEQHLSINHPRPSARRRKFTRSPLTMTGARSTTANGCRCAGAGGAG